MLKPLIKICGISTPEMAEQAALAGANFIGIVFHSPSPRYVDSEQALLISHAARKYGALPVGIFVNHDEIEMRTHCEKANIDIVQLHGNMARMNHSLLPKEYRRIYVLNVSRNGKYHSDDHMHHLDADRDWMLLDHEIPGQGHSILQSGFDYHLPYPWFLAGGLNSSNVASAIRNFQPDGVDVSSSVEYSSGKKCIHRIREFVSRLG